VWFQSRPEFANPAAILDLRIRRALAYGIDKQTFTEVVYGGELKVLDTIFEPTAEYYPAIDRAITKYPYDPRASERLMSEAGYTKGPDGAYAGPPGKLSLIMIATQGRQELPVLAAGWRQIGFDVHEQTLTQTQAQDGTSNAQFSALNVTQAGAYEDQQVQLYRPSEVPNPQNPQGMNRGGWVSPAYDRLVETFNRTMDPRERVQQRAEMGRMLTEELPSIVLTYNPNAHAFLSHVKGITRTALYTTGRVTWNIDKWEVQ
jgi:peptide/nickel transport system substrate-binding protein